MAAAALRSTANQINEVIESFSNSKIEIETLYADGGSTRNAYLMQLIADITGKKIKSSKILEMSAFGVALVAALGSKLASLKEISSIQLEYDEYLPILSEEERQNKIKSWRRALRQSRTK